jgi:hypothetical protein
MRNWKIIGLGAGLMGAPSGIDAGGSRALVGGRLAKPQERLEKLSREGAPERYPEGFVDNRDPAPRAPAALALGSTDGTGGSRTSRCDHFRLAVLVMSASSVAPMPRS